jgi:chemotaxis protein MotA
MNYSSVTGLMAAFVIFLFTVLNSLHDPRALINEHALVFVIGGTLASALIAFSWTRLVDLVRSFLRYMVFKQRVDSLQIVRDLVALAKASRTSPKAFEAQLTSVSHDFLREAGRILFWARAEITPDELQGTLEMRAASLYKDTMNEANMAKILAKFPPAFGLMGTTVGMIELLQGLGSAGDPKAFLGKAMSVALMATLYGLALSNFFFIPVGESLAKQAKENQRLHAMMIEGIMLIHGNKPHKFIEEHAKSFLSHEQRREAGLDEANETAS